MTDSTRVHLLHRLSELMQLCPEMRLGQLIANMAAVARGAEIGGVWEMEDDELLAAVEWQIDEFNKRRGNKPAPAKSA
jgi:hypothetical protein